jgi:hypothetical protein
MKPTRKDDVAVRGGGHHRLRRRAFNALDAKSFEKCTISLRVHRDAKDARTRIAHCLNKAFHPIEIRNLPLSRDTQSKRKTLCVFVSLCDISPIPKQYRRVGGDLRTWKAHLRKHGSALGISQPHAAAARQKRRDTRAQLFAQASLIPSDETKALQHKTPFAVRLEEDGV